MRARLDALLTRGLEDPDFVVREMALVACARKRPERAARAAEAHLRDDAPIVRRQAERLRKGNRLLFG